MSTLFAENLIYGLCILVAYFCKGGSFFEFYLFIMDHIEKIFTLFIAYASVFSFVFVVTKDCFQGLWLLKSFWGV
jgi:hypothetical protein